MPAAVAMDPISEEVLTLLDTFESVWETDREDFPLWTYVPSEWDAFGEPWVERSLWSPRQRVRRLQGRASAFWRYLYAEPDATPNPSPSPTREEDKPSWPFSPFTRFYQGRAVREIQDFARWKQRLVVRVLLETEGSDDSQQEVLAPGLVQAQVGAIFRAMGGKVSTIPERPSAPDLPELVRDLRQILAQPLTEDGSIPLAERLRFDHLRRLAESDRQTFLGGTYADHLEDARERDRTRDARPDSEFLLREPLTAHEIAARTGLRPDLSDGRATAFSKATIRRLAEEAEVLIERYRAWEPTDHQRGRLYSLLEGEENWSFDPHVHGLDAERLSSKLRRASDDSNGEASSNEAPMRNLLDFHLRWLRFPYLDSPDPALQKGKASARARELLQGRLPGSPALSTLRGYLSDS